LKKLMIIAAMLALVAVVAVAPALAQNNRFEDRFEDRFGDDFFDGFFDNGFFNDDAGINQSVDQQSESGDVALGYSVTNTGDYAFQCTPALQFGNTGNFNNAPSFLQYGSVADDFEPGGIDVTFAPQQGTQCSNTIEQSSAASSGW
jgi:opacity protein-like surface antigen